MNVNVVVCNASGNAMISQSKSITEFFRKKTDVKDICADGIRLHSPFTSDIDQVCEICVTYGLPFRRIDNWNLRVAMKQSGHGFGVYFA